MIWRLGRLDRTSPCISFYRGLQKNASPAKDEHNIAEIESKWCDLWAQKRHEFNQQKDRKSFSMLFPPPNVTGNLHLGHGITATIQDAIVRWKLMNNYKTLWIPGFDHAGIATQVIVERKIWNEKQKRRQDIGRDEFLKETFKWKDEKANVIRDQMIKLNTLVDWEYEYFTMDKDICQSVNQAFIELHDKGLIYRSMRHVNWCCALKSSISDVEVENVSLTKKTPVKVPNYPKPVAFGVIYKIAYPIADSKNEKLVVATTRPETMFGDTAIAVNPNDSRYLHLHNKLAINPLNGQKIPVILDETVKTDFGTGAVKVTPWHDLNDYNMSLRHKLPMVQIFSDDGHMTNVPDQFLNMPRFQARYKVIGKLKEMNLYEGEQDHAMSLPTCSRSGDVIEPMLKEQWFIDSPRMFQVCGKSVEDGSLRLVPENRKNLWNHYVETFTKKEWCISRQLWWGQQIPAYKCTNDKNETKWIAAHSEQDARNKARAHFNSDQIKIEQDTDVFDTWFTSTILPLATLGWSNDRKTRLFKDKDVYPTDMLETGFDIMYFWALRMVGMCHALSGRIPYSQILFHGLVTDSEGRKMSKSIGNVIDPMDLVAGVSWPELKKRIESSNLSEAEKTASIKYQQKMYPNGIKSVGSDATRLALLVQDFKSDTIRIDIDLFYDAKKLCNKIWQAVRYSDICVDAAKKSQFKLKTLNQLIQSEHNRTLDHWILNQLVEAIGYIEDNFDNSYNFNQIVKRLREFCVSDMCDFYLECSKVALKETEPTSWQVQENVWNILRACNLTTLLLYHPIMPSLTEELWQRLEKGANNDQKQSILDQKYPSRADLIDHKVPGLDEMKRTIEQVRSITSDILRFKQLIGLKEKPEILIHQIDVDDKINIEELSKEIVHLTKSTSLRFIDHQLIEQDSPNLLVVPIQDAKDVYIYLKYQTGVDKAKLAEKKLKTKSKK